jgi:hypothetical protein
MRTNGKCEKQAYSKFHLLFYDYRVTTPDLQGDRTPPIIFKHRVDPSKLKRVAVESVKIASGFFRIPGLDVTKKEKLIAGVEGETAQAADASSGRQTKRTDQTNSNRGA